MAPRLNDHYGLNCFKKLSYLYDLTLLYGINGFYCLLTESLSFFFLSDLGYQSVDAYQTLVVTVWIPFVDSNEQNGCLQVKKSTFYNVL